MPRHRTIRRILTGTGVGLSLVKSMTELHGGTVEARSMGPGTGSEFVVRLPLFSDGAPTAGRTSPTQRATPG